MQIKFNMFILILSLCIYIFLQLIDFFGLNSLHQMEANAVSTLPWICADQHFREGFIKGLRDIKAAKFDKHSSFSGELLSYVN